MFDLPVSDCTFNVVSRPDAAIDDAPKKQRWMKWYPKNWLRDPELRSCSRAARSMWADLVCLMIESPRFGYLVFNDEAFGPWRTDPTAAELQPGLLRNISKKLGDDIRTVRALVSELRRQQVFSITADGIIFCRHMVRQALLSAKGREHGLSGGNPTLKGLDPKGITPKVKTSEDQKIRGSEESSDRTNTEVPPVTPITHSEPNGSDAKTASAGGDLLQGLVPPPPPPPPPKPTATVLPFERGQSATTPRSVGEGEPPGSSVKESLWQVGRAFLVGAGGLSAKQAGSIIGKWLKQLRDDHGALLAVFIDAERERPIEPVAWITAAVRDRARPAKPTEEVRFNRFGDRYIRDPANREKWILDMGA